MAVLYKPVHIDGRDIIVGMKIAVVTQDETIETRRSGRITRITEDYLYRYLWVGPTVIGVVPKNKEAAEKALKPYEFMLLEDFMDEETHALSRALLDSGHNLTGNSIRKVIWELERLGFRIAKCPKHQSIVPKPVIETTCKRPAQ
jgi:hypothetical protein